MVGCACSHFRQYARTNFGRPLATVVKQRMQIQGSTFRSVATCFRDVYKAEGLSAFYVSYPTTLTMTVPFTAVQFSTYEFFK